MTILLITDLEQCKYCGIASLILMSVCLQDTVALLNKDLTAAQEKLLQAEHLSNQRLDELEAARSQLQVSVSLEWILSHIWKYMYSLQDIEHSELRTGMCY